MRIEELISKQVQNISGAFFKLSSRRTIIYSIGISVIALLGIYFRKSFFSFLGLSNRVIFHSPQIPLHPTDEDVQRKISDVYYFIASKSFGERRSLLSLVREIDESRNELRDTCKEDVRLMEEIYRSAMEQLDSIHEIAQALVSGGDLQEVQGRLKKIRLENELIDLFRTSSPDMRRIEELLQEIPVNKPLWVDLFGGTPLHALAKSGKVSEAIQFFVQRDADFNLRDDLFGNTPLLWAIANGNFLMAKVLIEQAPRNTNFNLKGSGNTALHLVLAKGYSNRTFHGAPLTVSSVDLMRLLIPRSNVNLPGRERNTPLHIACIRRDPAMIQALLEAGADRNQVNAHGETPSDMLRKTVEEAHAFLEKTASAYLLEERGSLEVCSTLFE